MSKQGAPPNLLENTVLTTTIHKIFEIRPVFLYKHNDYKHTEAEIS